MIDDNELLAMTVSTITVSNIFARKLSSNNRKQHSQRTSENDFLTYSFQEIMLTKIRKKDDF